MKGTEEPSDFLLKIIEIALISVTLIGTYFMVVDYNVSKISADPQRQALLIADGVLNCEAAYIEPSVLDEARFALISGCLSPFLPEDYHIEIDGNLIAGARRDNHQLFVTYAFMKKTAAGLEPELFMVYVKKT